VIAIIGILMALLLPAVQSVREAARRTACANNVRQLALALHNYESAHQRLPPGWISNDPIGDPGWGWASFLLPFVEQENLYRNLDFAIPLKDASMEPWRTTIVEIHLCPSDTGPNIMDLAWIEGETEPTGETLVAKGNYSGVFGTEEIEDDPSNGNGLFFHDSRLRFKDIRDGLSHTLMFGERRGDLGAVTWAGFSTDVDEAASRIVGTTDHTPNHPDGHFEDFRSGHHVGVNFASADGSVRMISDLIDHTTYMGLATRAGGELVSYD